MVWKNKRMTRDKSMNLPNKRCSNGSSSTGGIVNTRENGIMATVYSCRKNSSNGLFQMQFFFSISPFSRPARVTTGPYLIGLLSNSKSMWKKLEWKKNSGMITLTLLSFMLKNVKYIKFIVEKIYTKKGFHIKIKNKFFTLFLQKTALKNQLSMPI